MNAREERGLVIAATQKLIQKGKVWLVPSQAGGSKKYTVCPDPETPFCSCPDHEETGCKCKHIYAVECVVARERTSDGNVMETRTLTFTEKKVYKQDWPMYNLAQIEEKRRFLVLLHDLCRGVEDPPQNKVGRKRTAMADMTFAACLKVYTTFSSRRFGTDLDDAHEKGYVCKLHPVMVCSFLENELLTPALQSMIAQSAMPLRAVESVFAPDSTGFSTSRFVKWFDEKYGAMRSGKTWVKAHAMCGVKTNVVTAVIIEGPHTGDCPQFKPLVEATAASGFTIKEVPADKAYLSHDNLELVHKLDGTAYVPFKVDSQPGEAGTLWSKAYHFYSLRREEFLRHYHQRSNAESTFSMVKAKFRDHVRSKNDVAMKNEVLAKFVCHNICCLIQSQCELGIAPTFWGEQSAPAVQPPPDTMPTATPAPADDAPVDTSAAVSSQPTGRRRYWGCAGA